MPRSLLLLLLLLVRAEAAPAAEAAGPFAGDLGYPWHADLPLGASALYRLTEIHAELSYSRDQDVATRSSAVSKSTAKSSRDTYGLAASGAAPGDVRWGFDARRSHGQSVDRFAALGTSDLTFRYGRDVLGAGALAAYPVRQDLALGARYALYRVKDSSDTAELALFGERQTSAKVFKTFEPSLTWHGDDAELTATYEPKIDLSAGALEIHSPASLALWYLLRLAESETLLAGFEYSWWAGLGSAWRNAPELAFGERRRTAFGELGVVVRQALRFYRDDADADPANISRTAVDFLARWQVAKASQLSCDLTYGTGADRAQGETQTIVVGTEELSVRIGYVGIMP